MTLTVTVHPAADALEAYVLDALDPQAARALEQHVRCCDRLRRGAGGQARQEVALGEMVPRIARRPTEAARDGHREPLAVAVPAGGHQRAGAGDHRRQSPGHPGWRTAHRCCSPRRPAAACAAPAPLLCLGDGGGHARHVQPAHEHRARTPGATCSCSVVPAAAARLNRRDEADLGVLLLRPAHQPLVLEQHQRAALDVEHAGLPAAAARTCRSPAAAARPRSSGRTGRAGDRSRCVTRYSPSRRCSMISNCSTPTAPRMGSRSTRWRSKNSCTAPSSDSCSSPFFSCLRFSGSSRRTRTKCSGEKRGMPSNSTGGPSHRLSPMRRTPGIPDAQDVAGEGLVDQGALLGHELHRPGERQGLAGAHVLHLHAAGEPPRADAHEGDAVAVLGIHVRLDLEDEAREGRGVGRQRADRGGAGARRRGQVDEVVEERLEAEVVHGAAEEHRRHLRRPRKRSASKGLPAVSSSSTSSRVRARLGRAQRLGQLGVVPGRSRAMGTRRSPPPSDPFEAQQLARPSDRRRPRRRCPAPAAS